MSGALYLHPTDPGAAPPADAVLRCLQAIGLIGTPLPGGRYLAGAELLRLITFAGCSPQLEFLPPADGRSNFCHVGMLGPYATPRMLTGSNTLQPRCPACNHRVNDWRALDAAWRASPGTAHWRCPGCDGIHPIARWRWRRHAVFGRLLVAVHGVFPAEAVPDDRLLDALREATGMPWGYGWAASD